MKNQAEIVSQNLLLEPLTAADSEFVRTLVNTEGWIKFIGQRNVHSKEDAIAYTQKIMTSPNIHYWIVKILSTKMPIGVVTLIKRDYLEHHDIGFAFLPQFSGKGYAIEAARALLTWTTQFPEYNPILATTLPDNANSIKLLTKLEFRFTNEIQIGKETLQVYSYEVKPQ